MRKTTDGGRTAHGWAALLRRRLTGVISVLAMASGLLALGAPAGFAGALADPHTCKNGYVWREAFAGDFVCVTPAVRTETAAENRDAALHREPLGGVYGPDTCKAGYVWREARPSDHVCVIPSSRDRARSDNASAVSRLADAGSLPSGSVWISVQTDQLYGYLYASGSGLTPNGRVTFWAVAPGAGPSSLGSLTANAYGSLSNQYFYGTYCQQVYPTYSTIVVLDTATGNASTAGSTIYSPWC